MDYLGVLSFNSSVYNLVPLVSSIILKSLPFDFKNAAYKKNEEKTFGRGIVTRYYVKVGAITLIYSHAANDHVIVYILLAGDTVTKDYNDMMELFEFDSKDQYDFSHKIDERIKLIEDSCVYAYKLDTAMRYIKEALKIDL